MQQQQANGVADNELNDKIESLSKDLHSNSSPTYIQSINDSQINDENVVRQAIAANKLRKYRLRQRRSDLLNQQIRFVSMQNLGDIYLFCIIWEEII